MIELRLDGPHEGDPCYHVGKAAGLPCLAAATMHGEYPIARIEFSDASLTVDVALTALSPLVPLNSDASGIPDAILRHTVANEQHRSVPVAVIGSMSNSRVITGLSVFAFPELLDSPQQPTSPPASATWLLRCAGGE